MFVSTAIPMNLQLFSDTGASAGAVAEPQGQGIEPSGAAASPEPQGSAGQPSQEPGASGAVAEPDKVEKAFAARLAAEKAKIEGQFKPYLSVIEEAAKEFGFNSVDEYLKAYENAKTNKAIQKEADKYQASPELIKRIQDAEAKLAAYEQEKQQMSQKQWEAKVKADILSVVESAKKEGVTLTEEQILGAMVEENIADPSKVYKLRFKPETNVEELKQKAIAEYIENIKNGRAPVEGGGASPVVVSQSPKTFEDARKGAFEMLRAARK